MRCARTPPSSPPIPLLSPSPRWASASSTPSSACTSSTPVSYTHLFKTVAASVLSILIGLAVGSIVILIVGLTSPNLSLSSAWDGIRIVFGGLFSTGRDASGTLMWGFNPTNIGNMLFRAAPLIMTGLSVGMAYKTGLFNIGAPGQYLIGTLVSLSIALGLPSETMSTTLILSLIHI